jgi:hypothetical protein
MASELTVDAVRADAVALLEEASYRDRACDLALEIGAMPAPEVLVPVLLGAVSG